MKVFVVNGWAASPEAWSLCAFRRDMVFSYIDALNGLFEEELAKCGERVVCVGWSMGASVILQTISKHIDKVQGLVLLAGTSRMMAGENWRGMNEIRLRALKRGLMISLADSLKLPGTVLPYAQDSDENLERGLEFLRTLDCREALADAKRKGLFDSLKVYLFQSENDAVVPRHNAEFLKEVFPLSSLVYVAGSEHALPVVIPREIDQAVEELVQNV